MNKYLLSALFVSCFLFTIAGYSFAEPPPMPKIVTKVYMAKYGCKLISDFYKHRGDSEPPFVWGYATGKGIQLKDSIAFWCRDKKSKNDMLIVEFNRKKEIDNNLLSCPSIVRKERRGSAGLSLFLDVRLTLDKFNYVDKKGRGPKQVQMTHNGIKSEYDGFGQIYYCYKKDWLIRILH